jgi:hypothetical protein
MCTLYSCVHSYHLTTDGSHSVYVCSQTRPTALSKRLLKNTNQPPSQLTLCITLWVPSIDHYSNKHPVDALTLETDPILLPT